MPAKKRRKRRKRNIPILPVVKNRQYYEHDNRKSRNNYTAVAKKFRPLIESKKVAATKNIVQKSSSLQTNLATISTNMLSLPLLLQCLNAFAQFGVQEQYEFSHITQRVRETHQIAAAQQEKNAKLREAFNISECFVEGSSFGSFKNTKEEISKNMALQKELDEQIGALKATAPTFELEKSRATTSRSDKDYDNKSEKKKKKKRQRSRSSSTEYKSSKRKKSKKQKKERLVH